MTGVVSIDICFSMQRERVRIFVFMKGSEKYSYFFSGDRRLLFFIQRGETVRKVYNFALSNYLIVNQANYQFISALEITVLLVGVWSSLGANLGWQLSLCIVLFQAYSSPFRFEN